MATITNPVEVGQATTPRTPRLGIRGEAGLHAKGIYQTCLDVDAAERGDEDERDHATSLDGNRRPERSEVQDVTDGEGGRIRSELARDLVQRIDELVPLLGDVSLATHIGLLKRDLSRCHEILKAHPGEGDYLSIVTLVESALARMKWKQYCKLQLETIRQVLEVGYRQVRVRFEDYENARAQLSRQHVDSTPRIDLESLSWEEVADAEET